MAHCEIFSGIDGLIDMEVMSAIGFESCEPADTELAITPEALVDSNGEISIPGVFETIGFWQSPSSELEPETRICGELADLLADENDIDGISTMHFHHCSPTRTVTRPGDLLMLFSLMAEYGGAVLPRPSGACASA